MLGRLFNYMRHFFEVAGAIQLLGSVGGATVAAILLPAVLGAVLNLPIVLQVILAIAVFFVTLALILAAVKWFLERQLRTQNPVENQTSSGITINVGNSTVPSAESAQPNSQPPQESATRDSQSDDLVQEHLKGKSLRVTDLVSAGDPVIQNRTFEDCTIYGPAIILPGNGSRFENIGFDSDSVENLLWELPYTKDEALGVVMLDNCVFQQCRFIGIGIAALPDIRQQWRDAFPESRADE